MWISDWSPKYTVNHPVIDDHHYALFRHVDRLSKAIIEKKEHELIDELLGSLLGHAKVHFADEERFLSQVNYPDLSQHKEAHERLVARVQDFHRRHKDGDSAVAEEMSRFMLIEWFVHHIIGMDELYAPYFKETVPV